MYNLSVTLRQKLRRFRLINGYPNPCMAYMLDISAPHYHNLENGTQEITEELLPAIYRVLGM